MTDNETGGTTTRFQPHRATGRQPSVKSRRQIRGPWQPALAIVYLLLMPVIYLDALADGSPWYVKALTVVIGLANASVLTRWVIDLLLWSKER